MNAHTIKRRNNVNVYGHSGHTLMFAHGFGCDQTMWRYVTESLQHDFHIVAFDYVGSGHSDLTAFNPRRYATLEGYASDINEILETLDLNDVTLIGHSVSSTIGIWPPSRHPTESNSW